jgi:hypothetical protein
MVPPEHDHELIRSWSPAGGYLTVDARSEPGLKGRRRMTSMVPAHGRQAPGLPIPAVYLPLIPRVTGRVPVWSKGRAMGRERP